jgi:hypothetical protein
MGVRVDLGKLYIYADGHANLTFPSTSETTKLNLPLIDDLDVIGGDGARRMTVAHPPTKLVAPHRRD